MRQTIKYVAIVFLTMGLAGLAFGEERILLAKASLGDLHEMSMLADGHEICLDNKISDLSKHNRLEFAGAELNDTDLGKIRGRALNLTAPEIPDLSASAIILWDEPGAKGSDRMNRGNPLNINTGINMMTTIIKGR